MDRLQTTVRLDEPLKKALERLSEVRHVTMNRLINQAVERFVTEGTSELAADMNETLDALKAYRASNVRRGAAIERIVASEAAIADDPVDGEPFTLPEMASGATEAVTELLNG